MGSYEIVWDRMKRVEAFRLETLLLGHVGSYERVRGFSARDCITRRWGYVGMVTAFRARTLLLNVVGLVVVVWDLMRSCGIV